MGGFGRGAMEPSPMLAICFVGEGAFRKNHADQDLGTSSGGGLSLIASRWEPTRVAVTEVRNWHRNGRRRSMSNAKHIYSIAANHAQTVQVCIDRLHELGANEQLKLLNGRLQKLAVRATPGDDAAPTGMASEFKGASRKAKRSRMRRQPVHVRLGA